MKNFFKYLLRSLFCLLGHIYSYKLAEALGVNWALSLSLGLTKA